MEHTFIKDYISALRQQFVLANQSGTLTNTFILSVSDGMQRAKVRTLILELSERTEDAFFDRVSRKITALQDYFTQPLKWLRLEWVTESSQTTWGAFKADLKNYKRNYFRSGIAFEGKKEPWLLLTEMELNGNLALYAGSEITEAGIHQHNLQALIKARHGSSQMPKFQDNDLLLIFKTAGYFFDLTQQQAYVLDTTPRYQGHRQMPPLSADVLPDLIQKITSYLGNQVTKTGLYEYGWFPCFDRAIGTYNTLRHASSTYALIEGYELSHAKGMPQTDLDRIQQQIELALGYLEKKIIRHYADNKAYVVEINGEIKLGANAVAILALVKYLEVFTGKNKERYLPLAECLANGIVAMQQENGRFVHILDAETLNVLAEQRMIYYDGEAAFGLMRLYGVTKDPRWLACVEKAFDYFIAAGHAKIHDHWLSYCSNELTIYKPERKYFQFAVDNVKGFVNFIRNRITTYPTLLELSMAFHKCLLKLDEYPEFYDVLEGFDVADFYDALHTRANYLLNGVFFPEMAMFYKNPQKIEYGCFIRHHSFRVRIDDVEHYLSGYVAYQHFLESSQYPLSHDKVALNETLTSQSVVVEQKKEKRDIENQHFIFFHQDIPKKLTGIESSAFKRYGLFEKQLGIRPLFLTTYYNSGYLIHAKEFIEEGRLSKDFQVDNLYHAYQRQGVKGNSEAIYYCPGNVEGNRQIIYQGKRKVCTQYFNHHTQKLSYTHYHDEKGLLIRLDNYDYEGFLSRTVLFRFNEAGERMRLSEIFYKIDGTPCIYKYFEQKDGKAKITNVLVTNEQGVFLHSFSSDEQLHCYLLQQYLHQFDVKDQVNLLVDRTRLMKNVVVPMEKTTIQAKLKCLQIIHNVHLKDAQDVNGPLSNIYAHLEKLPELDGVIILTDKQRKDITSRFGDVGNTYVIPHAVNFYPEPVAFSQRKKFSAIAVGRLNPQKRFADMVRLFAEVVKKLPEATLDIYGHGSLEGELNALIQSLNMQNHIRILSFTDNVYEKFSQASVSLLTSKTEGFPLVVQESLVSGCPVISTDIRYGPSAMIESGYNGFLVDKDDEEAFVERVVEVLSNPDLNATLSQNAYQSMQKFDEPTVAKQWKALIETLEE